MIPFFQKIRLCVLSFCVGISCSENSGIANDAQVNSATSLLQVSSKNPRYFENADGKTILLAGSHTWLNAQDGSTDDTSTQFDYDAWLDFLQQHNHNFFRLWVWEQAAWAVKESRKVYFEPTRYLRTGPGLALDGRAKFDVTRFNPDYFDRVRDRIIEAGNRGIYVSVMLFNGFGVTTKGSEARSDPWNGHPFNRANNINGVDGDLNRDGKGTETHELNEITALQKAFVRKMIDTVNDLDNVLYEISNESHSGSTAWQYHMIEYIRSYEADKPRQHPIGMTYLWPGGTNKELYDSTADWVSYHGELDNPVIADGRKVIISDTDHHCGSCGNRQWAWKSFTRGENPLFMDPYIDVYDSIDIDLNFPPFVDLRKNLGYIRSYSQKIDLSLALPCGKLASTKNCLGYISNEQAEFILYFPDRVPVSVDLSRANYKLDIEWFNPQYGTGQHGGSIMGGSSAQDFQPPWSGDAILYISRR